MPAASHHPRHSTSLHRIRRSYFIHESQVYSVATAPSSIFKTAINAHIDKRQLADNNMLQETENVLEGTNDIYARWWLLCYAARSMRLYESRDQAEAALEQAQRKRRKNSDPSQKN